MLAFGGKRRLGENDKLLQGHGATYHIISFQTVTCISTWQRSLLQQFVLPLFTSLMTSFLKACFADVYSTWLGSIRRRLPHTTQTQAPISPFCLWGPQKKRWPFQQCFVKWVLCSLAEDLWYWPQSSKLFTLFKLSLSVASTMVWFVRRAFETKKRGFWNSWRKCPKRVVPV